MILKICLLFSVVVTKVCGQSEDSLPLNEESALLKAVLAGYDKRVRPVEEYNSSLNVTIVLYLIQMIDVDEKKQTITTHLLLDVTWQDTFLKWDPSEHSNITKVWISRKLLWRPDIVVSNMADLEWKRDDEFTNTVLHDGKIMELSFLIVKTSCKMDVTWFPFDEQKCKISFTSWGLNGKLLDLNTGTTVIVAEGSQGQWDLLSLNSNRSIVIRKCPPETPCSDEFYIDISYTIHIKRRTLYYFFNLIVPCGLIGFLALLGFTLPPDSGEKLPLGVTVLFSLIVFLNQIADSMPANSDSVPLLGTYFNCVMFMIASSVISTIVVNLNHRSSHVKELQGRTKRLFLYWIPRILRMKPPEEIAQEAKVDLTTAVIPIRSQISEISQNQNEHQNQSGGSSNAAKDEKIKKQWIYVAIVVDRLCLIFSILFSIIAITVFLVSAFSGK